MQNMTADMDMTVPKSGWSRVIPRNTLDTKTGARPFEISDELLLGAEIGAYIRRG
jgi:hypothetical protein